MSYALSTDITGDLEDVFTVDADRLGVFTDLPQSKVHVAGDARLDGDLVVSAGAVTVGGREALTPDASMLGADLRAVLDSRYLLAGAVDLSSNIASLSLSNLVVRHSATLCNVAVSGRVGVGTSNPGAALDVRGDAVFCDRGGVVLKNPAGSVTGCVSLLSTGAMHLWSSNWPVYGVGCSPSGVLGVRGSNGIHLGVGTANNSLVISASNGYVGIGKVPTSSLDVAGSAAISGSASVGGTLVVAGDVGAGKVAASAGLSVTPTHVLSAGTAVLSGALYTSRYGGGTWTWNNSNDVVVDSNGMIPWSRLKGVPASLSNSSDTALGVAGVTLGAAGLVMGGYNMLNSLGMLGPGLTVQLGDNAQPDGETQADVTVGWDHRLGNRPVATCPYRADIGVYGDLYVNQNRRLYALDQSQFGLNEKNSRVIPDGVPPSKCTEVINFGTQSLSLKTGLFSEALQVGPFFFKPDRRGNWSLWMGGKQLIGPDGEFMNQSVPAAPSVAGPAAQGGGTPIDRLFKSHINNLFDLIG
jgi:hypothetical protein